MLQSSQGGGQLNAQGPQHLQSTGQPGNFVQPQVNNQLSNPQEGFDILRLSNPTLENVNEDFICSICQKILNNPRECSNTEQCGQLFCAYCCKRDGNQCPACKNGIMKNPSKIIMKIYSKYEITCSVCCIACPIQEVLAHEAECTRMKCNNELCGQELSNKVAQS